MTAKDAVKMYLARIGAKGGKTTGATKARTSEQAHKAAMARWGKRMEKKA